MSHICFICEAEFNSSILMYPTYKFICVYCCKYAYEHNNYSYGSADIEQWESDGGVSWYYGKEGEQILDDTKLFFNNTNKDQKCHSCQTSIPHSKKIECIKCYIDKLLL
jgi:hypothetical protein